jgi:hypothetical protein
MRKLLFIGFVTLGALVGLLASAKDDWATRIVMMGIGALFGAPLGAAVTSRGKKMRHAGSDDNESDLPGTSTSAKDLSANYWRDKGHPPLMKPTDAEPDMHMFDPDKLG